MLSSEAQHLLRFLHGTHLERQQPFLFVLFNFLHVQYVLIVCQQRDPDQVDDSVGDLLRSCPNQAEQEVLNVARNNKISSFIQGCSVVCPLGADETKNSADGGWWVEEHASALFLCFKCVFGLHACILLAPPAFL